MSLLAPLFLLGGLAVAFPILFHLIRRTTRERTPFSSLMFLNPSPPRLTKRSRLEHLFLLALRCSVLCLLALGFARPFIKKEMPAVDRSAGSHRTVVLLDASASMSRADLWSDARAQVEAIIRRARPSDQITLCTFDRQLRSLISFDDWNGTALGERSALASQKLAAISPGWSATHLSDALTSAAELLADSAASTATGPRDIIMISDLQEGGRAEQLQGFEWPKGVAVEFVSVRPRQSANASLHLVTEADAPESKAASAIRLRVSNSADSKQEQFKVESPHFRTLVLVVLKLSGGQPVESGRMLIQHPAGLEMQFTAEQFAYRAFHAREIRIIDSRWQARQSLFSR